MPCHKLMVARLSLLVYTSRHRAPPRCASVKAKPSGRCAALIPLVVGA